MAARFDKKDRAINDLCAWGQWRKAEDSCPELGYSPLSVEGRLIANGGAVTHNFRSIIPLYLPDGWVLKLNRTINIMENEEYKDLLMLRYVEGMDYGEIGAKKRMHRNTVSSKLLEAIDYIKKSGYRKKSKS